MAAWQFKVSLVPKNWVVKTDYDTSLFIGEYGYDTSIAWVNNQPKNDIQEIIKKYLPKAESWCEGISCWGDNKTTDIQVCFENGLIEDITIRIDLNEELTDMIKKSVLLAEDLNCIFYLPEADEIIERNEYILTTFANNSNAAKFVKKPEEFLRAISNKT